MIFLLVVCLFKVYSRLAHNAYRWCGISAMHYGVSQRRNCRVTRFVTVVTLAESVTDNLHNVCARNLQSCSDKSREVETSPNLILNCSSCSQSVATCVQVVPASTSSLSESSMNQYCLSQRAMLTYSAQCQCVKPLVHAFFICFLMSISKTNCYHCMATKFNAYLILHTLILACALCVHFPTNHHGFNEIQGGTKIRKTTRGRFFL